MNDGLQPLPCPAVFSSCPVFLTPHSSDKPEIDPSQRRSECNTKQGHDWRKNHPAPSRFHKTSNQVGITHHTVWDIPTREKHACKFAMTFEATPPKVSRPLKHAFVPTVKKPSPESKSLSRTVGPLPLLDTLLALPLPACLYGPLHQLQEDLGLPLALGKQWRPHEGCPCGQSRDQCVLTQLQASQGLPWLNKRPT
ncbi:hypothetical protein H4582DRAFT_2063656 [Lactarius indigo]|nr:hypothetical protein H4582DRAFT_2063656 [Lactarius indigo]